MSKEIILKAIAEDKLNFEKLSEELKDDYDITLAAIKINSLNLSYTSDRLKNDKTIALAAIYSNTELKINNSYEDNDEINITTALKKLDEDKEIVLQAEYNSYYNKYGLSPIKLNSKNTIFKAIINDTCIIGFLSKELQDDKIIVLAAVNKNGYSLKYASDRLKNDKDVVFAAVSKYAFFIYFASKELQTDKVFLIECYKNNKHLSKYNEFIKYFDQFQTIIYINIYDNDFINNHYDVLHLVDNKIKLYNYLLSTKKYDIIYKNEEIHEYIKEKFNIIILCLNDLDPDNTYKLKKLKLKYKQIFINFNVKFIKI